MLKNYLRSALRHLVKSKLFSAINIAGLAVGLAACILIALYVQDETSYDEHWANADRIYRVNTRLDSTGRGLPPGVTVASMAAWPALEQFFADEIEHGARVMQSRYEVLVGRERFAELVTEVDSGLIRIFELEVLAGDLEAALDDANGVALSEAVAARLFPDRDALGEVLTFVSQQGTAEDYRVGAVYRLPDGNTVLDLPAMIRFDMARNPWMQSWGILAGPTYVQLAPDADIERVRERIAQFTDQHVDISSMMAGPRIRLPQTSLSRS